MIVLAVGAWQNSKSATVKVGNQPSVCLLFTFNSLVIFNCGLGKNLPIFLQQYNELQSYLYDAVMVRELLLILLLTKN